MTVPWAKGFVPPTKEEIDKALGSFPCKNYIERGNALQKNHDNETINNSALEQVNINELFHPKEVPSLKHPTDENDWLACYKEEGQNFDEYVDGLTLRSGRFRTHAGIDRTGGIVLVPIVTNREAWPDVAPQLEELQRFLEAFFMGTSIHVTEPACLKRVGKETNRVEWKPPKGYNKAPDRWVKVRCSHKKMQVNTESLLWCLTDLVDVAPPRIIGEDGKKGKPFCVVGLTFEDLYESNWNLFIAGSAAGRSHVAVVSFFRYNPYLRMSPLHWWKYGFCNKKVTASTNSYFEPNVTIDFVTEAQLCNGCAGGGLNKRKRGNATIQLMEIMPKSTSPSAELRPETLRRACKLLCHEILHIYQIDHCIYKHCLMNGTGHLLEDFTNQGHLCGIDLRKLQYRLGFDTVSRYNTLAKVWLSWGCAKEARWYQQRGKEAALAVGAKSSTM